MNSTSDLLRTIELSFARFPVKKKKPISLPNKLDMPNNKDLSEARLIFED